MWKAYYRHDFFMLLELLVALFKEQFKVGTFTAWGLGYYSMQAARHFRKTGDMQRTEQYLMRYYGLLQKHAAEKFDSMLAAKTELEWWVIHRYPSRGSLPEALASNVAALYSLPASKLKAYAQERAKAMELRDTAAHTEKTEPNWNAIQKHLEKSYRSLLKTVARSGRS